MAKTTSISFYEKINFIKSSKTIPIDLFYESVMIGKWESEVTLVREIKDKKTRDAAKVELLPSVTIAGLFVERTDAKIDQHSGRIAMDVDEDGLPHGVSPSAFRDLIAKDKYVEAAFLSASGRGVCVVFKINPVKHKEAFKGLSEYIFVEHKAVCDPTSINPSRARFVSYDPELYLNLNDVPKFAIYPKEKPPKKIERIVYAQNDFDELLNQIISRHLNICDGYHDWLRCCFGIVHKFGEAGRNYFHLISQFSTKYDAQAADKQFTNCVKHKGTNTTTIATIYYYCKLAGLELYSERTKKIAYTASSSKKAGLKMPSILENLKKHENIEGEDVAAIVQQVLDNNIELNEDALIHQLEMYIRQTYDLRRNEVTKYIENSGTNLEEEDLNTIYIQCKKVFDKMPHELMDRLIHSNFVPNYHPFIEFFEANKEIAEYAKDGKTSPVIDKYFSCLINEAPEYCLKFGKKWLVGMISTMLGFDVSELVLVLCGPQRKGKTWFFRGMLPKELKTKYYVESKLDAGKDDYILMTQSALLVDDEYGGKSKKEAKLFKDLTSKDWFSVRPPYGRHNIKLKRTTGLGGTTNELDILSDTTGNTRVIPIIVRGVNFDLINSIDRTELIMEAYHLFKAGFNWKVVTEEEQKELQKDQGMFQVKNSEEELILKYFDVPQELKDVELWTASDIKVHIEKLTQQRLSLTMIGKELGRIGFEQIHKRKGNSSVRYYKVKVIDLSKIKQDEPPF